MGASVWIGPAIVAAIISALITAAGWYVSHISTRRLENARRRERIQDVQTAIRAEIRSHVPRLRLFEAVDLDGIADNVRSAPADAPFTPFVPQETPSFVFDAIVGEIHLLPTATIDPVVYYYRQIATLAQFAQDLRSDRYAGLDGARKMDMYKDYIALGAKALELAQDALRAIEGGSSQ